MSWLVPSLAIGPVTIGIPDVLQDHRGSPNTPGAAHSTKDTVLTASDMFVPGCGEDGHHTVFM